jgi:hypothetical protein
MYSLIFGGIAAVVGLLAAGFWFKASTVQVVSKTLGGWGSMMGGELVVRGTKGERLDFIETFVLQSIWNKRAAVASGIAAGFGGIAALLGVMKL